MATRSRSFPMASSTTWPHFPTCKYTHTRTKLYAPDGSLCDIICTYHRVCVFCTHVRTRTRTHCEAQRGSGQTAGERGSQWPVCAPLWWARHEPSPPLISRGPVVKVAHRPLYCLICLSHLNNTHTHTHTHTQTSTSTHRFSMVCGLYCLFIYVCNFTCVCVCVCVCVCGCGHM